MPPLGSARRGDSVLSGHCGCNERVERSVACAVMRQRFKGRDRFAEGKPERGVCVRERHSAEWRREGDRWSQMRIPPSSGRTRGFLLLPSSSMGPGGNILFLFGFGLGREGGGGEGEGERRERWRVDCRLTAVAVFTFNYF